MIATFGGEGAAPSREPAVFVVVTKSDSGRMLDENAARNRAAEQPTMSQPSSPLLGFNNNVRHGDRTFHIQTEDSGRKRPHVITHLFYDGGRILKSVKTSYADMVDDPGLVDHVRALMKAQHKEMFVALRAGEFDDLVEAAESRPSFTPPAPQVPDESSDLPPARAPMPSTAAIQFADDLAPTIGRASTTAAAGDLSRDTTPEIVVEYEALERAAEHSDAPPERPPSDLPPPPPAARRDSAPPLASGRYFSAVARESGRSTPERVDPRAEPESSEPLRRAPSVPPRRSDRGVASVPPPAVPVRPASIPPAPRAATVTVRPRLSDAESALDDVIRAYLSEDFEGSERK